MVTRRLVEHPGRVATYCPDCGSPAWTGLENGERLCSAATVSRPAEVLEIRPLGACGASWLPTPEQLRAEQSVWHQQFPWLDGRFK